MEMKEFFFIVGMWIWCHRSHTPRIVYTCAYFGN